MKPSIDIRRNLEEQKRVIVAQYFTNGTFLVLISSEITAVEMYQRLTAKFASIL